MLRDVARGLAGLHKAGIVHCDLTPDSIQVNLDGKVKLNAFTPARIRHAETTVHSLISGTPAYLAPEIYQEEVPTPVADLFSLAVIAYELIAGQRPFQGASLAECADAICRRPHVPLREVVPEVPERLSNTLDLMLAKDPAERLPNAAVVAAELASAFRVETPDEPEQAND